MFFNPCRIITYNSISALVPEKQLLPKSVVIQSPNTRFADWSGQDHTSSLELTRLITQKWKEIRFAQQYLVYGKIQPNTNGTGDFAGWEIVPYQNCRTFIGRIVQQLLVLWRTVFGGVSVSEKEREAQAAIYRYVYPELPETKQPSEVLQKSDDAFCKNDTIERQWVVTGNKVNALFNYAPIGLGGERLHFLVVPKRHAENFTDVTEEEYCESMDLTQKLIKHFTKTRENIENVYLLHKTGADAGQTVKHWHLHLIFSTTPAQDFWGKLTVVKNILLGASPMKADALAKKVGDLRAELASLT